MKILVIPDVHLKPDMFVRAGELMRKGIADNAVCLMDIPDDWKKQYCIEEYERTFDAAITFAREYPYSLWCYGNHDLSYVWNERESGYSPIAPALVCKKLNELNAILLSKKQMSYIHAIDNVLFSHGGLSDYFVKQHVPTSRSNDVFAVVETVNSLDHYDLWCDDSPIWYRPQYYRGKMYKPRKCFQVVGHTPVKGITKCGNILSCDVFSTYQDGTPIGTQEFVIIDTITWEYYGIK